MPLDAAPANDEFYQRTVSSCDESTDPATCSVLFQDREAHLWVDSTHGLVPPRLLEPV